MFNIFLLVFQTQIVQKIKSVEATPKIWPPVSNNDFRSKSLCSIAKFSCRFVLLLTEKK